MRLGRARLAVGEGVSIWVLEAPEGFGEAGFHAHHAIQLTVCLNGALTLATEHEECQGQALAVAADTFHRFEAHGLLAFIFVEPESAAGRTLTARLFANGALAHLRQATFLTAMEDFGRVLDSPPDRGAMLAAAQRAIDCLAPITCLRRPDERIQRVLDFAAAHLDQPLSLELASQSVFLSPSRLRHLFVEQTGLAFRTYVLWRRLMRAVHLYSEGNSLTESAHGAGFSDSAHFSRVFKRTFGLPATTLTRL